MVSTIANCELVTGDDGKPTTEPLSMADIITTANTVTDNWPRRVADALFVHAGDDVHFLRTDSALFGYYHSPSRCALDPRCTLRHESRIVRRDAADRRPPMKPWKCCHTNHG